MVTTEPTDREKLAAVQHEIWSYWMKHLFSRCVFGVFGECEPGRGGTMTIPAGLVERWSRQMNTEYYDLSEQEKESDRHEADRILAVLSEFLP